MPQLDTSTFLPQLFWLGVCFLVLYLMLSSVVIPKIARVLEKRSETIEEKINKASTYREEAEILLRDYEAALAQARETAHQKYKEITDAALHEVAQQKKDFLEKLKERLHMAEQELYTSRIKANREAKSIAGEVASQILKKVTGKVYKPKDILVKED